jgi:hypothetical protein
LSIAGIGTAALGWAPTYRLVPSRFPPISLFERVASRDDLETVFAIEALTNPRLRQEAGDISLVPREERVSGPGSSAVMAAFTHLNPLGSRFSSGSYGVYYAAKALVTAVREVGYHQARFLTATREGPIAVDLRCYRAAVREPLHDIRGAQASLPQVYERDGYGASQVFGAELRAAGSWGVVYDSVRDPGGECVGIFRPRALGPAVQGEHVTLRWNGTAVESWYVTSELRPL